MSLSCTRRCAAPGMSALRAARVEAVLAHLAGGQGPYWALSELLNEFVGAQGWTPVELEAALDTLAAAGRVELDGEAGQVLVMLVEPALRAAA